MNNIFLTITIFLFSLLFSIIGFLTVDKLGSIDKNMEYLRHEITTIKNDNYNYEKRLLIIENNLQKNK